ncbi:tRNA pseudouridine55 synthase [Kribbella orskensis]|uniref:tRNA pseudouridine synthase B n=1 Tax=Kribbella orskensis TaxID=2512216 RepID=A0ABY2BTG3_9ACTN|nr:MULTISPECIES: tRNA pseudouridine(55) synthase TruB [Kribbella]TCN43085.1 tRNA pseudouridine55 synthase [Kribbella sp. VKM Ac-2500]TCO29559.1 tRNA pseudouridine55 synthase [Kribbella orskensis]
MTPTTSDLDFSVADGIVVVDKPAGLTSHTVVARIRRLAGTRKVGHAGTLDPMATGVLVVGLNRATRLLGHLQLADKSYDATILLGASSSTDDAEGEISPVASAEDLAAVTVESIEVAVAGFRGEISQVPSKVSAIKVDGRRAYERVRAGEEVALKARSVTISRYDVVDVRPGALGIEVDISVDCSSGTYIRALARDLGAELGVGGHLTMLRRTRVGAFGMSSAHTLEELGETFTMLPIADVASDTFPRFDADAEQAAAIRTGRPLPGLKLTAGQQTAMFDPTGTFLALYEPHGPLAKPTAVFVS